ncbi:MAG: hypothetical protein MI674_00150 [Cytophagales bacterium]|nr:hypothetical protein [Cytophagales bacterium]
MRFKSKIFLKKEIRNLSKHGNTIFHYATNYLLERYKLRFNTVKMYYEVSPIDVNDYVEVNEDKLHIEINKAGIRISLANVVSLLKSGICKDYNPIQDYFRQLPSWQEGDIDYIDKLASYIKTDLPHIWPLAFKKWLVRTVRGVMELKYFNKNDLYLCLYPS